MSFEQGWAGLPYAILSISSCCCCSPLTAAPVPTRTERFGDSPLSEERLKDRGVALMIELSQERGKLVRKEGGINTDICSVERYEELCGVWCRLITVVWWLW